MSHKTACAAPGCQIQVTSPRFLMCHEHWRLVPTDVARHVTSSWWAHANAHNRCIARMAAARYRTACEVAIASLRQQPQQPQATEGNP
jgi:hypothetical protein